MSGMRKIARNMAREISYQGTGTTDLFKLVFRKIWREKTRHPECMRFSHTKARITKDGKRRGYPMRFKPLKR